MEPVNIHQAKTQLSQLLHVVEQGEEVVIARAGVPIARLVSWQAQAQPVAAPGAMRGQIQFGADFDAPLEGLFEALQSKDFSCQSTSLWASRSPPRS
jgi:prevent-host-death family protein